MVNNIHFVNFSSKGLADPKDGRLTFNNLIFYIMMA